MKCLAKHGDLQSQKVIVTAALAGIPLEVTYADDALLKSKPFATKSPFKLLPVLESGNAQIATSTAAIKLIARSSSSQLYAGDNEFLAKIDHYLDLINQVLNPNLKSWLDPIYGVTKTDLNVVKNAQVEVKKFLIHVEQLLKKSQYVLGDHLTLVDVSLAIELVYAFRLVFDAKYRNPLKSLTTWFTNVTGLEEFRRVIGVVRLAAKALDVPPPPEPPKQEQPKPVVAAAPAKKAEPKPAGPSLDDLPPSSFVMDEWKALYANTADKNSTIPYFFEKFDPEGWSVWYLKYQMAEGEGEKLFMTSNLLDGFTQRLEALRKYSFGVLGIYGEEPNLQIYGVMMWRGTDVAPQLHDHPSFEYYDREKLDVTNEAHRNLITEYWTKLAEGDVVEGRGIKDFRVWK